MNESSVQCHWESDALYDCPICGETNAIGIDVTGCTHQRLLEDCPVCCRPLVFSIAVDRDGDALIESVEAE
ncbi:MAG: CPXCG motif-containing cysteine-rich protein [Candidatus Eremiobacteraeota bacterium]|nr:CPXCG motif-containing cysteine-rich protein [Candidatus Eremiobacteraeota bacterium]